MSIYDYKVKTQDGEEISMDCYKGKTLLIVNTAKDGWIFFCPIRHAVILSALNIMNGFMQRQ